MTRSRSTRTGTLEARRATDGTVSYVGRLRLADGSKSGRMPAPAGSTKAAAQRWLAALQTREDAEGIVYAAKVARARDEAAVASVGHPTETADAWHARYLLTKECGEGHRRVSASSWKTWIAPVIGEKPVATLTRDDLEDVRDALDRAIDEGRTRPATAANVWSTLTSAMRAAYAAKDRTLRVHTSPLYVGILPPRDGASRSRPWLYPSEWLQLATCEAIPLDFRTAYALALYTGLRPNELRALTWGDVDLAAGVVRVSKAWDPETKEIKPPKTGEGTRVVPLRPELAAVLRPGASSALVVGVLWRKIAVRFRADLQLAGVNRTRLFASTATEEEIDFRSLRDSYATWRVLSGVDPLTLKRELGHLDLATSDRYVKEGASFRLATVGDPFPAIPFGGAYGPPSGPTASQVCVTIAPTAGLESTAIDRTPTLPDVSPMPSNPEVPTYNPLGAAMAQVMAHENDPLEAAIRAGLAALIRQAIQAELERRRGSAE